MTQQELTVDVPELTDNLEATVALGRLLWQRGVAPATTRQSVLWYWETVVWKGLPVPVAQPDGFSTGLLEGTAAAREDSPVVVMHTGHADGRGRRRFFLAGAPASWVPDGLMTMNALNAAEAWGRLMMVGLSRHITGSPLLWLLRYPQLLPVTVDNPSGVAFRRVEYLRCCWHTERAPDPSPAPWP